MENSTHVKNQNSDALSGAILTSFIESFSGPVFALDADFYYLAFNKAHADVMKSIYNAEIQIGHKLSEYQYVKSDWEIAKKNIDRALKGEKFSEQVFSGDSDLDRLYFEVIHSPIVDVKGLIIGVLIQARNITQRVDAEQKASFSEKINQQIIQNALDGFWMVDMDGHFLEVNNAFCEMTGYSRQELLGMRVQDVEAVESEQEVKERIEKVKILGQFHFVSKHKCKNGQIIDVDVSINYLKEEQIFFVFVRDITYRIEKELLLTESEEKFRNIFDNSIVGKSITTITGELMVNDAFAKIIGYSKEELYAINWKQITHPEDIEANDKWVKAILKAELKFAHWEKRYIHKNGNLVWVDITTTLQRDVNEQPLYFITEITDITEKKKIEIELNLNREKFKDLFENAPIGYHEIDSDGRILQMNYTELETLGYTIDEVRGRFIWELFKDESFSQLKTQQKLSGKEISVLPYEREIKHKNGKIIPILLQDKILLDDNGKITGYRTSVQDNTERKQVELALLNSEEKFKKAFLTSPDAIAISRLEDGMYVSVNAGFLRISGYSEEELIGKTSIEISIWKNLADREKLVRGLKEKGVVENLVVEFTTKNEETIYGLMSASFIELNGLMHLLTITRDVTNVKKAEFEVIKAKERAERSELFLNNILNNIGDPVFVKDDQSRLLLVNDAFCNIFDLNRELILGKTMVEDVAPHERESFIKIDKQVIADGIENINEETLTVRNAPTRTISTKKTRFIDNTQQKYLVGIIRDMTERKLSEKALAESEQKLSTLFASMTEMVVVHELVLNELDEPIDYKIIDCNDAFTRITGIKKEDAVGNLASEVYQVYPAPYLDIYTKVCITGENIDYASFYAPRDKYFFISVVPMGIYQFATITTDITEIQNSKEALLANNKELENYIYVASHDLRSPLVNIQGFSLRLKKQSAELKKMIDRCDVEDIHKKEIAIIVEENISKSLNYVQTNVTKMDKLINGLLQVSRTGRIELNIRKVNMNNLMRAVVNSYNFQLTEIDAHLTIQPLTACFGDENQLNQLFSNILSNAIKYRSEDRKLQIEISSRTSYNKVLYIIRDNGIGINERHLEKIWDVFYRVDASASESGEGLGLSLAKRITDKHKGKIRAESVEGEGTTFFIELHKNDFGDDPQYTLSF